MTLFEFMFWYSFPIVLFWIIFAFASLSRRISKLEKACEKK